MAIIDLKKAVSQHYGLIECKDRHLGESMFFPSKWSVLSLRVHIVGGGREKRMEIGLNHWASGLSISCSFLFFLKHQLCLTHVLRSATVPRSLPAGSATSFLQGAPGLQEHSWAPAGGMGMGNCLGVGIYTALEHEPGSAGSAFLVLSCRSTKLIFSL